MFKNILIGIAIGIANIIPGVSGGTMMVIFGIFERLNEAIANISDFKNKNIKDDVIFLLEVFIGAAIGLIAFANILNLSFEHFPTQTIFWFIGLVAFSIPVFIKKEIREGKIDYISLMIGMVMILFINDLALVGEIDMNPEIPALSIMYLTRMLLDGIIGGFSMLLPGVSGSMILLIMGDYYLFKSLLSSVLALELRVWVSLGVMGIGIILGILLASRIIVHLMKKHKEKTSSFLLGLVSASTIVLIPAGVAYDLQIITTSLIAFLFGGALVLVANKLS